MFSIIIHIKYRYIIAKFIIQCYPHLSGDLCRMGNPLIQLVFRALVDHGSSDKLFASNAFPVNSGTRTSDGKVSPSAWMTYFLIVLMIMCHFLSYYDYGGSDSSNSRLDSLTSSLIQSLTSAMVMQSKFKTLKDTIIIIQNHAV